jgi:hypothetical protein
MPFARPEFAPMRALVILLLLALLGFIAWKASQRSAEPKAQNETAQSPADAPEGRPAPSLPSFDIVRVDRTGYAVIAGRALSGAKVSILANGAELASTIAEKDGSWVVTTETPLAAGSVELRLVMTAPDGRTIQSEDTIIIYVPQRDGDRPLVLRTTPGGATKVLQEPRDADAALGPLTLDTIDYDDSGAVIFSGRAEPGRTVELYIRREDAGPSVLLDRVDANAAGRWMIARSDPPILPGRYRLLIVQLDANRAPAFAIEAPFERARPEDVDLSDGRVIVQPGNSLWRIARRAYGRGAQYTIIYEANADQIRDPDLIYPGQIFTIPEEAPAEGEQP